MKYILIFIFANLLINVSLAQTNSSTAATASPVLSAIDNEFEHKITSQGYLITEYDDLNTQLRSWLNIPFYFNVPYQSFSVIPNDIITKKNTTVNNPVILFNYRETNPNNKSDEKSLGLRLIAINDQESRTKSSEKLAASGLIQTGDIIITARPEWYGTLVYSHVQLGVSHAGMAMVKNNKVYNIDMPLNDEMMGDGGTLSSDHYRTSNMFHILRYKNLNDLQKQNITDWLNLFFQKREQIYKIKSKPDAIETYKNKITFNMNYGAPNYSAPAPASASANNNENLKFVADLARLALGYEISGLSMFCSEFLWSVLSLKDCSPTTNKLDFKGSDVPSCINKAFEPTPVFGNLFEETTTEKDLQIGMTDGPALLAEMMGTTKYIEKSKDQLIKDSVFKSAKGKKEGLSQGHKMVEAALLKGFPQLYNVINMYYSLSGKNDPVSVATRMQIRNTINQFQKLNYSPTSFMVQALLPETWNNKNIESKKLEYVGTLLYLKPTVIKNQTVDLYQKFRSIEILNQP